MKDIYGIFDGKKMIVDEDKFYPVPPNYAGKSKLIDGDGLKLTITDSGEFLYKQVDKVPRKKVFATVVEFNESTVAIFEEKIYGIQISAINYFRLKSGDQIIIEISKDGKSKWCAVEGNSN